MPWRLLDFRESSAPEGSLPMVGRTLSLADRLTNNEKGINQTHRPKYEAISVKVGMSEGVS